MSSMQTIRLKRVDGSERTSAVVDHSKNAMGMAAVQLIADPKKGFVIDKAVLKAYNALDRFNLNAETQEEIDSNTALLKRHCTEYSLCSAFATNTVGNNRVRAFQTPLFHFGKMNQYGEFILEGSNKPITPYVGIRCFAEKEQQLTQSYPSLDKKGKHRVRFNLISTLRQGSNAEDQGSFLTVAGTIILSEYENAKATKPLFNHTFSVFFTYGVSESNKLSNHAEYTKNISNIIAVSFKDWLVAGAVELEDGTVYSIEDILKAAFDGHDTWKTSLLTGKMISNSIFNAKPGMQKAQEATQPEDDFGGELPHQE